MRKMRQFSRNFHVLNLFVALAVTLAFSFVFSASKSQAAQKANPADATEVMNIWPEGARIDQAVPGTKAKESEQVPVKMYVFLPDPAKATGQGVVICPGGGYAMLCIEPEGYKIARWLNRFGIAGFVLEYRIPNGRHFVPLNDAQRAIRTVRTNAARWQVKANQIGIIGFSAGGHLASSAATHFDKGCPTAENPVERVSCRPDFAILVYPVVSFGREAHSNTKKNLVGVNPPDDLMTLFSNETQVGPETPPTFLAHAKDDKVVPPSNSGRYTEQMKKFNRPVRYIELEYGGHGLQGYKGPMWDQWQSECIKWLGELR